LIGVLEGSGLVSLSSSGGAGTPRAKKTFSRSTSFGAGVARNGVGSVGEVRLVDGIWGEEILRCLGAINTDVASSDPREEEIRAIWEREKSRSSKDMKAASRSNNLDADVFSGAFQR
jgi:cell division control protein 6